MLAKQPTHIRPLVNIERKRLLSGIGEVTVSTGQEVNAGEMVAQAELHDHHILVDVRQALQLKRADDVLKVLNCKPGEKLEEGDIIAEAGGLFKRVVRAPMNGVVTAIAAGKVILEVQGRREQIRAGYSGIVTQVMHRKGVLIQSHGALVQGVWGNHSSGSGILTQIGEGAAAEMEARFLTMDLRGAILFAGRVNNAEILRNLVTLSVRGLIVGSMSAALQPLALEVKFPFMLTEGFGNIGMNLAAYEILHTVVNRKHSSHCPPRVKFRVMR